MIWVVTEPIVWRKAQFRFQSCVENCFWNTTCRFLLVHFFRSFERCRESSRGGQIYVEQAMER